jgi:hypothetical protein
MFSPGVFVIVPDVDHVVPAVRLAVSVSATVFKVAVVLASVRGVGEDAESVRLVGVVAITQVSVAIFVLDVHGIRAGNYCSKLFLLFYICRVFM